MNHRNSKWIFVVFTLLALVCHRSAAAKEPREIMAGIHAVWLEKQRRIQSIECSGKMKSIYVKGGMTSALSQVAPPTDGIPDRDMHFSDQPFRWWIDFDRRRLRRDTEFVTPRFTVGSNVVPFEKMVSIDLVVDEQYRHIRTRSANPWLEKKNWEVRITGGSIPFAEFDSLPIFWTAGCVSAQPPRLSALKKIDDPALWSFRGEATRNGVNCFVITLPEGKGNALTRELWVGTEAPHLIHFCTVQTARGIPWQIEATYVTRGSEIVPTTAKYTEFDYPRAGVAYQRTYSFDEFNVNPTFSDSVFDHSLEPGTTVSFREKKGLFEVKSDGTFAPYREKSESRGWAIRVAIVLAICLLCVSVVWWLVRRRRLSVVE